MRQSVCVRRWNHVKPRTSGCARRVANMSVTHAALSPPVSVDPTSPTNSGLSLTVPISFSPAVKTSSNDDHRPPFSGPQLYPSSATWSTYASPGYSGAIRDVPAEGTFGDHAQVTLVTPSRVNTDRTCRHART